MSSNIKKKDTVMDGISSLFNSKVVVKFTGGREVIGTLKGFDQLVNLVLDDCIEQVYMRDAQTGAIPSKATGMRPIGLVVCRGTCVTSVAPYSDYQDIPNPF